MEAQGRLFPMTGNAFRLAWERVKKRAEIVDLRFHDLRHEAISRLFERGLTTPEVAMISGHRDMRMLFRYSHAMREAVLEKLDKVPS
jgi:integrase